MAKSGGDYADDRPPSFFLATQRQHRRLCLNNRHCLLALIGPPGGRHKSQEYRK